jgi:transposase
MILVTSAVQVWLAAGHTDIRKGQDGLTLLVQETLRLDSTNGHLFVTRGRSGERAGGMTGGFLHHKAARHQRR